MVSCPAHQVPTAFRQLAHRLLRGPQRCPRRSRGSRRAGRCVSSLDRGPEQPDDPGGRPPSLRHPGPPAPDQRRPYAVAELFAFVAANQAQARAILGNSSWEQVSETHAARPPRRWLRDEAVGSRLVDTLPAPRRGSLRPPLRASRTSGYAVAARSLTRSAPTYGSSYEGLAGGWLGRSDPALTCPASTATATATQADTSPVAALVDGRSERVSTI